MDDTLQRLLDTELRAEKIAKHAELELDRLIQDAMAAAQTDIKRFEESIPSIYSSHVEKAELRAEQDIAEMKRRHDNRHALLRARAEDHSEGEVLDVAFAFLIDPASDRIKSRGA